MLRLVAAAVPVDTPEAGVKRRTALYVACANQHLVVAEVLLAAGADTAAKHRAVSPHSMPQARKGSWPW